MTPEGTDIISKGMVWLEWGVGTDHEKERRTRVGRREEREDVVFMKGERSLDGDRMDVRKSNRSFSPMSR
jgi:hypothetical protein